MSYANNALNDNSTALTRQVKCKRFHLGQGDLFNIKAFRQQWTFKEKNERLSSKIHKKLLESSACCSFCKHVAILIK